MNSIIINDHKCYLCNKRFMNKHKLTRHFKTKQLCVIMRCEGCREYFIERNAAREHSLVCGLKCKKCKQSYPLITKLATIPQMQLFSKGFPSQWCQTCFDNVRDQLITLLLCLKRIRITLPLDNRVMLLSWII